MKIETNFVTEFLRKEVNMQSTTDAMFPVDHKIYCGISFSSDNELRSQQEQSMVDKAIKSLADDEVTCDYGINEIVRFSKASTNLRKALLHSQCRYESEQCERLGAELKLVEADIEGT